MSPPAETKPAGEQAAGLTDGTPTVGALFYPGMTFHVCTASVVDSPGHNIILTAAHCLAQGNGKGYTFAPGYDNGKAPYGVWTTTAAYADPLWVKQGGNQRRDFVFLTVKPRTVDGTMRNIQDVVGGNRLGLGAYTGETVRLTGYLLGFKGKALTCRTKVVVRNGYPVTHCYGFADGTSGGPWLAGTGMARTVVGTISGLHQGGCSKAVANSTPLGKPAEAALLRAEQQRDPSLMPARPSDGCKNGF